MAGADIRHEEAMTARLTSHRADRRLSEEVSRCEGL